MATSQIRTVWSQLAEASQLPSGATATAATRLVRPVRAARSWPVAVSQIRTVPSPPPEASQLPSGATATASAPPVWPVKAARSFPVTASQIRTVPSPPPEASQLPSGATATASAPPVWPVKAARSFPVTASQIRTVPSPPPEASQLPSGATATARTDAGVAGQDGPLPPGGRVPDPHRAVPAAGGQPAAIRRHRHRRHRRPVWLVKTARSRPVATSQIRTVRSSLAEASQLPSGATATASTSSTWPVQDGPLPPGRRIPDPHRLVPAGGGQPAAIRRHRHRQHPVGVTGQHTPERGGSQIRQRPAVDQPRPAADVAKGGDLRPPVRVIGDPAMQDIHHDPGRLCGRQQMRRAHEHTPQPGRPRCPGRGQVSSRGGRPEPLQPRPHPPQVTCNSVRLTGPPGIPQMLDEVIPQVPVLVPQLPPGHPHRAPGTIKRARCGQVRRDRIQEHDVQLGQPLPPEPGAQEIADHVMQGNATIWPAGLRYQGKLSQPLAHLRGPQVIQASRGPP